MPSMKERVKKRVARLNERPANDPRVLWAHFSATYLSLRAGMAVLALCFPALLYLWGRWVHGLPLQPSMSAYFWAADTATQCAAFPMRTIFVGVLIAIGAALYFYKGLTTIENILLNCAAVCAAIVAIVPERLANPEQLPLPEHIEQLYRQCATVKVWALQQPSLPWHYAGAAGMFVFLFFVARNCAAKSLDFLPANPSVRRDQFERIYQMLAWLMPAAGVLFGALIYLKRHEEHSLTFWLEATEIWIFAVYWAVKTFEMSLTKLEKDTVSAVERARAAPPPPQGATPGAQVGPAAIASSSERPR